MKAYWIDTNVMLRFLLKDNLSQFEIARKYINQAKAGKVKITLVTQIIFELEFVLRKVYKESREEISKDLIRIIQTSYLEVESRLPLSRAISLYNRFNIDLIDAFLFIRASEGGGEVLSFDKDFLKLRV